MAELDAPWDPVLARPLRRDAGLRRSFYLPTRDGTRLAVDVTLPSGYRVGDRLPTMLRQTRYFRSVELPAALDFEAARDAFDIAAPTRERFLGAGYAWVDVDVRGSGVSFGSWPLPWSPAEVADGREVVEFIVKQPWSNGRVGSTGISYEGTTAEMLTTMHHEAVRAVAPRFSLLCAYEDVAFPGGAQLAWFTEGWSRFNALLDAHEFHRAMAELMGTVFRGHAAGPGAVGLAVRALLRTLGEEGTKRLLGAAFATVFLGGRRVDEDPTGRARALALADHFRNGDVHDLVSGVDFRDDSREPLPARSFELVSPRGNLDAIRSSGVAVWSYGGFLDGAYAQAAARRFRALPGSSLLLGPWGHAGVLAHPGRGLGRPARFPHEAALLAFFDAHLKDGAPGFETGVRYFTLGANTWRRSNTWPPPEVRSLSLALGAARSLDPLDDARRAVGGPTSVDGSARTPIVVRHDPRFGTGDRTRWRGVLAAFVAADYPDLALRLREQVAFDGAPLARSLTVTGHPTLELVVRADVHDLVVIAYLLDVAPDGSVHYVTEGHLRALHRASIDEDADREAVGVRRSFERSRALPLDPSVDERLRFSFLPTSYELPRGHHLRLVLTLGDADHFAVRTPPETSLAVLPGLSVLELPVAP
jgi:putative CocE/NonD family hydrolase